MPGFKRGNASDIKKLSKSALADQHKSVLLQKQKSSSTLNLKDKSHRKRRSPGLNDSPGSSKENAGANTTSSDEEEEELNSKRSKIDASTLPSNANKRGNENESETEVEESEPSVPSASSKEQKRVHIRERSKSAHVEEVNADNEEEEDENDLSELVNKRRVQDEDRAPTPHRALKYYQDKLRGLNTVPVSGTIKKVRLFNFMCHESFEKEWHPNLNFIIGENGSGKSAVLSGILIGLGARALCTSRTKSIASLVKTGTDSCKIEVTLVNKGLLKTGKYGKELIIQRIINSKGVSTYKIHDGIIGKFRPLLRNELDIILLNLGILLDNPVAILNQETARSFLKTKDPSDKYNFFYEGTLLSAFDKLLSEASNSIDAAGKNIEKAKNRIKDYKDEVDKYEGLKAKLDEIDDIERKIDSLSSEYFWCLVTEDEASRNKVQRELDRQISNHEKLKSMSDKLLEKKNEIIQTSLTSPEALEALREELRGLGKREQDLTREIKGLSYTHSAERTKISSATKKISSLGSSIARLEEKIEHLRTVGSAEAERQKREYEEELEKLRGEKSGVEEEIKEMKREMGVQNSAIEELRSELGALQEKERAINGRIRKYKDDTTRLKTKNSEENKYAEYGAQMTQLVATINANKSKFKKLPRGPIGACIKVKDAKWINLIEFILSSQLHTFIVDNNQDLLLLRRLISQIFPRRTTSSFPKLPTIILQRFGSRPFDVSRSKATTQEHPTIYDMLEVDGNDHIIMNNLIDSSHIERMLLIETNKIACDLLKDSNAPNFPRKCLAAFTLQFSKVSPDPKYRLDMLPQYQGRFLKSNNKNQIRYYEKAILEAEKELESFKPEIERLRAEESSLRSELNAQGRQIEMRKRKVNEINLKVLHFEKGPVKAPDVHSFVEELNDQREELDKSERELEEATVKLTEVTEQIGTFRGEKTEVEAKIGELQQKMNELKDTADQYNARIEAIDLKIRETKAKVRDAAGNVEGIKPKLERAQAALDERLKEAGDKGERINTTKSSTMLEAEISTYRTLIEEAKKIASDREMILRELHEFTKKYTDLKNECSTIIKLYHLIKVHLDTCLRYVEHLKTVMANVLIGCFISLTSSRGYKGRLFIEHETRELHYFICPDDKADQKTNDALATNNNKYIKKYLSEYGANLSGGERSFSTICFIISMWQIMECPFFMLDEFDVFMDPFNRKASQNALMSHAKRFSGHQFFLFTPLELTEMHQMTNACVLKMYPPNRNSQEGEEGENGADTNNRNRNRRLN